MVNYLCCWDMQAVIHLPPMQGSCIGITFPRSPDLHLKNLLKNKLFMHTRTDTQKLQLKNYHSNTNFDKLNAHQNVVLYQDYRSTFSFLLFQRVTVVYSEPILHSASEASYNTPSVRYMELITCLFTMILIPSYKQQTVLIMRSSIRNYVAHSDRSTTSSRTSFSCSI